MVVLSDYVGREQSYVKHVFLENYLERLVHKTAGFYSHIIYVDGFAGPWQSANERLEDTSFGIALAALRSAKRSWKARGRDVRMSAFLVERDAEAYHKLAQVPAKYPDLALKTFPNNFLTVLPEILNDIPKEAFAFFLIDPTGWRIPIRVLEPMLARARTEVIFNFMFDFINRAVSIKKDTNTVAGLNELMPEGDWRLRLGAFEGLQGTPEDRHAILVEGFRYNLAYFGKYEYVAETTVLRPTADRPLYCLFYATRNEKGIEVFRDCQVLALKEQSRMRAAIKLRRAETKTGQGEIFQSLHDMAPNELTSLLQNELRAAETYLLNLTPEEPAAIRYDRLWPRILSNHVIRKTDVNRIAGRLYREGKLKIPDWEKRKQIPQAAYRIQRPKS